MKALIGLEGQTGRSGNRGKQMGLIGLILTGAALLAALLGGIGVVLNIMIAAL